eukprot:39182-Eustigmatos_ZCMA.PRE.1
MFTLLCGLTRERRDLEHTMSHHGRGMHGCGVYTERRTLAKVGGATTQQAPQLHGQRIGSQRAELHGLQQSDLTQVGPGQ